MGLGAGFKVSQLERQVREAERLQQVAELARIERALVTVHHQNFAPATRAFVPLPPRTDPAPIEGRLREIHIGALGLFEFAKRRQVAEWARQAAFGQAQEADARMQAEYQRLMRDADLEWRKLVDHDPVAVRAALEAAFDDDRAPAVCLDVDDEDGVRYATVAVLFPGLGLVPEKCATVTPAGRPTLKPRTKTDRNQVYLAALGSTVLAAVKEGFAAAPSVQEFRVVAVRVAARQVNGFEAVFAGRFDRERCQATPWTRIDPAEALAGVPGGLLRRTGRTREVAALDPSAEPGLAAVLAALADGLAADV
ncbi:hypothetical protein [Actinomadura rupiterrae]|uniref:hypothetical protein n=1 Tax=Actinomadura rupiterrae TaxID=559627 RepID=UPI0020A32F53|nr:hypothetical protein [Actinomadura rupiterrae]MCP2336053.1 hypothetical protein [Actinomadura rupiterrae]